MLVDFACVLRDEGLSAREIAEQVESASHRVRLFGIVNTLEYLHKGGRLPASMAVVGTLLKVKPLITLRRERWASWARAWGSRTAWTTC